MQNQPSETARAYFDYYTAEQRAAQQQQVDIGKWILGSLILVNGGAITLLAQAAEHGSGALKAAGGHFVIGIICALFCGFVAWLNAGVRDAYLDELAKPEMLTSSNLEDWPKESSQRVVQIRITFGASVFFGFLSAAMFGWGAWIVTQTAGS